MGLFSRSSKLVEVEKQESNAPVITIDSVRQGPDYLVELVKQIRPRHYSNHHEADLKFKALFYKLQNDSRFLFSLRKALLTQFLKSNFVPALTESGMVGSRGFLQEFMIKVKHKLLPPLLHQADFLYIINHVFYKHHDHIWVVKIDRQLWKNFFKVLGIEIRVSNKNLLKQLNHSLYILSQRTVTLGLEKEVTRGVDNFDYENYSFFNLDKAVQNYLLSYQNESDHAGLQGAIKNIVRAIQVCKQDIEDISENRRKNGTSLSQTYMLFRIEQHLERLLLITDVLDNNNQLDIDRILDYFITVIVNEKRKNSLRAFVSANFSFLAFKITEHGGSRGEKYITATRKDYWSMLRSAMGGGFIVSFTALVKNLIAKLALPPFWQGFTYSINYAAGFQIMHETHTTLATKQPAFTASALAGSLDYFKEFRKPDLIIFAITIARTSRSQLASFFGNLVVVFPMAFGLAALYHKITGHLLLEQKAAEHLLVEQHPLLSLSILYACFTGFFSFFKRTNCRLCRKWY
jgi:site-specific recombinase